MSVKRYWTFADGQEEPNGKWVKYEDHEAKVKKLAGRVPDPADLRVLLCLDTEGDLDAKWNDAYDRLRATLEATR